MSGFWIGLDDFVSVLVMIVSIPWIIWDFTVHYSTFTVFRIRGVMATAKTTTLTFRIEPELKEALRTAAQNEHRSIANMVAVLIRDYCERNDIAIADMDGQATVGNTATRDDE